MLFNTNKDKGRAGIALAIAYFGANGYTVSIPLNDTQEYDLIIDKDTILNRVQVKSTGRLEGNVFQVKLETYGGNNKLYSYVKDSNIDILFVVTSDGTLYSIPKNVIIQKTALRLNNDFDKYIVSI